MVCQAWVMNGCGRGGCGATRQLIAGLGLGLADITSQNGRLYASPRGGFGMQGQLGEDYLTREVVRREVRTYRTWRCDQRIAPTLAWRWLAPAQAALVYFAREGTI